MTYFNEFLALAAIAFLGALAPGPDFIIVTFHSLKYGRKAGFYTAFGVGLGCLIHITYCVAGIGYIVMQSVLLFNILKYVGAAYLVYIGVKALLAKSTLPNMEQNQYKSEQANHFSSFTVMKKGFLVNALNPKATLFFVSVFSQVISPETPWIIQASYGLEMALIGLIWFCLLSIILTTPKLKMQLNKMQKVIDKLLGGFLVALGLKIATISQ